MTDSARSLGTARPGFIDTAFQRPSMNRINPSVGVQSRWQEAWGGRMVQEPWAWVLGWLLESAIVNILQSMFLYSHCSFASFNMFQHLGLISPMFVDLGGASSDSLSIGFPVYSCPQWSFVLLSFLVRTLHSHMSLHYFLCGLISWSIPCRSFRLDMAWQLSCYRISSVCDAFCVSQSIS